MNHIRVEAVFWADQKDILSELRERVFIQEQGVPAHLEWDHADASALHWLVTNADEPVGCARVIPDPARPGIATLGRVAVLPHQRRSGIGSRLLHDIVTHAPARLHHHGYHCAQLVADVQCSAVGFYLQNDWHIQTPVNPSPSSLPDFHWDADMPHVPMATYLSRHTAAIEPMPQNALSLGMDTQSYHWDEDAEDIIAISLMHSMISQAPRSVLITITNIRAPLWSHDSTIRLLLTYLKGSRHRQVTVLLQHEFRGLQEHPLVQLSHRISRLSIRHCENVQVNQLLACPAGYMEWTPQAGDADCNHPRECSQRQRQFEQLHDTSCSLQEGRRVHL